MIPTLGIADHDRAAAADLYWQAFGSKLGKVLGPAPRARAFLENSMSGDHAICIHDSSGALVGLAGFKTFHGALLNIDFRQMAQTYGAFGSFWRLMALSLLGGEVDNQRFLMDGIVVAQDRRGSGIGTALIEAISREALRRGYSEVRLEVIDSNPRAQSLYERRGFEVRGAKSLGLLRHIFGYRQAITMIRALDPV